MCKKAQPIHMFNCYKSIMVFIFHEKCIIISGAETVAINFPALQSKLQSSGPKVTGCLKVVMCM